MGKHCGVCSTCWSGDDPSPLGCTGLAGGWANRYEARHEWPEAHVFAAERLHGDDTPVPVLAKGKTDTGRCWVYVRDDLPFGGTAPPAAMFYCSRDRGGEHPQAHLANYAGIFQADAYSGYNKLYEPDRKPGPIVEAACWVHYPERSFFRLNSPSPCAAVSVNGQPTSTKAQIG